MSGERSGWLGLIRLAMLPVAFDPGSLGEESDRLADAFLRERTAAARAVCIAALELEERNPDDENDYEPLTVVVRKTNSPGICPAHSRPIRLCRTYRPRCDYRGMAAVADSQGM
ncbi:hypothetical protein GGX14DRAFT_481140 [Mycena pura]|uniref:Uncharacterized protein n=1 Tax=Mycena pura TaxID=153505 RepID=A0AAD6UP45_9AGAR|nr:hypothetical protein GGX14DRAFT_481140 [Mycena pura]